MFLRTTSIASSPEHERLVAKWPRVETKQIIIELVILEALFYEQFDLLRLIKSLNTKKHNADSMHRGSSH
jgi:hypothetical protein